MNDSAIPGLAGIRVLELAGSIGIAWAAKLFADLGAEVVRVETERDFVRSRPHGLHRWLNSNKRSVATSTGLVAGADLVIHDRLQTDPVIRAFGLGPGATERGAQVVLAFTPFGLDGFI